ncbi:protein of unknown function [Rhizobium mongolense subsp. loessense]|uniref:eCIS core domain-containing protein n=1 Tax=Rhizobium mongolense subsp. loessense TaxID=158890 RepID=A0A1G4S1Z6_9HYPH|nr:DUF4157 domain-containing protein [Rhizobium mongolense]SCW63021.1 protein of unknown function [Rhizobium mongolense subsp. loessense]
MMTMTVLLLTVSFAVTWAQLGDIDDPEQFLGNVQRDAGNADSDVPNIFGRVGWEMADIGKELDRVRSEAQVLTAAAALEQWIIASRNSAHSSGVMPMPPALRQTLGNFYDEQIYDMAAFKIGGSAPLNLADLAIRYGGADAVTLIDTVIFKDQAAANDPGLWVHELKHVEQFRNWGTRSFSIRYLRNWKSVEDEAYAATDRFNTIQRRRTPQTRSPNVIQPTPTVPQAVEPRAQCRRL